MRLSDFFAAHPKCALAFSGGVDSSYLLYAGLEAGAEIRAYYVKTAFQPMFELEDARRLARELGARLEILEADILAFEKIAENPEDRCYHCKSALFSLIKERAAADGFDILLDGSNASDSEDGRPGMRALRELSVRSPLRECGLSKEDIRGLSRQAGLFCWNKPAYSCLATRIPSGRRITADILARVERAEGELFKMGFSDLRVRVMDGAARLQLPGGQLAEAVERREEIGRALEGVFPAVLLDLKER